MPDPKSRWKRVEVSRALEAALLQNLPNFRTLLAMAEHDTGFRLGLFRGEKTGPRTSGMWVLLYPDGGPVLTEESWAAPARGKATAQPPFTWVNKLLTEYFRKSRRNQIRFRTSNASGRFLWQAILGSGNEEVRTAFWASPEKALIDLVHRTEHDYVWDPQAALALPKEES